MKQNPRGLRLVDLREIYGEWRQYLANARWQTQWLLQLTISAEAATQYLANLAPMTAEPSLYCRLLIRFGRWELDSNEEALTRETATRSDQYCQRGAPHEKVQPISEEEGAAPALVRSLSSAPARSLRVARLSFSSCSNGRSSAGNVRLSSEEESTGTCWQCQAHLREREP